MKPTREQYERNGLPPDLKEVANRRANPNNVVDLQIALLDPNSPVSQLLQALLLKKVEHQVILIELINFIAVQQDQAESTKRYTAVIKEMRAAQQYQEAITREYEEIYKKASAIALAQVRSDPDVHEILLQSLPQQIEVLQQTIVELKSTLQQQREEQAQAIKNWPKVVEEQIKEVTHYLTENNMTIAGFEANSDNGQQIIKAMKSGPSPDKLMKVLSDSYDQFNAQAAEPTQTAAPVLDPSIPMRPPPPPVASKKFPEKEAVCMRANLMEEIRAAGEVARMKNEPITSVAKNAGKTLCDPAVYKLSDPATSAAYDKQMKIEETETLLKTKENQKAVLTQYHEEVKEAVQAADRPAPRPS